MQLSIRDNWAQDLLSAKDPLFDQFPLTEKTRILSTIIDEMNSHFNRVSITTRTIRIPVSELTETEWALKDVNNFLNPVLRMQSFSRDAAKVARIPALIGVAACCGTGYFISGCTSLAIYLISAFANTAINFRRGVKCGLTLGFDGENHVSRYPKIASLFPDTPLMKPSTLAPQYFAVFALTRLADHLESLHRTPTHRTQLRR